MPGATPTRLCSANIPFHVSHSLHVRRALNVTPAVASAYHAAVVPPVHGKAFEPYAPYTVYCHAARLPRRICAAPAACSRPRRQENELSYAPWRLPPGLRLGRRGMLPEKQSRRWQATGMAAGMAHSHSARRHMRATFSTRRWKTQPGYARAHVAVFRSPFTPPVVTTAAKK